MEKKNQNRTREQWQEVIREQQKIGKGSGSVRGQVFTFDI
jgi:hypothetical protein